MVGYVLEAKVKPENGRQLDAVYFSLLTTNATAVEQKNRSSTCLTDW